ncbi:hypothetical protein [Breoghania sp.]|uniref:hypothetical protein n=1 Tax=Breoghania sp. TaxID=2065378 RepID=UPI002AAB4576|nr:hypothetical protein [Breoghania sp.]
MKYEDTTSRRVSISGDLAVPTIRIKAKKNYFILGITLIWLCNYTYVGSPFGLASAVFDPETGSGRWIVLAALAVWGALWLVVSAAVLWMLIGREEIEFKSQALIHRLKVGPFSRQRVFDPLKLRNLRRLNTSIYRSVVLSIWEMVGVPSKANARMAFDYGERTIYFAYSVAPAESTTVRDAMIARLGAKVGGQHGS